MFSLLLIVSASLLCSCSFFMKKPPPQPQSQAKVPYDMQGMPIDPNNAGYAAVAAKPAPITDITKIESAKVGYKKNDITFNIVADEQLNRYQNSAHALFVCIYQLKDPNAFNQYSEEKGGIPKLLECGRFDSSVASAKRIIMQPGQQLTDVRDRAEGTRFIGLVTGYFGMEKVRVSNLSPLAVHNGDYSGQTITINLGSFEIDSVMVK
ncbi:MAG: type VI secretion lipoprotein TssJ [Desulfuromonadaceae bacterium]